MERKELTLNEYQKKAMSTCMESCDNFSYMFINLVGEVGEFASKVAKQIRKENLHIGDEDGENVLFYNLMEDSTFGDFEKIDIELMKEAGDILWQLAGLCHVMGWEFNDVGQQNLDKLQARKKAGTIDGSGDGIIREK